MLCLCSKFMCLLNKIDLVTDEVHKTQLHIEPGQTFFKGI